MQSNTLRHLDRYVGVPVCCFLTVLRWIFSFFSKQSVDFSQPRKFLIIKLSEMGSTVLAYPSFLQLKNNLPESEMFFITFIDNRPIVDALGLIRSENIITINDKNIFTLIGSGFYCMFRLLTEKIDVTIDMDFFSRFTAAFAYLICRKTRVGFHNFTVQGLWRGNLLTHPVMYSPHVHTSIAFFSLISALFVTDKSSIYLRSKIDANFMQIPDYRPDGTIVENITAKLKSNGVDINSHEKRLIIVNPNSSDIFPLRKWPCERFAKLCSRLFSEFPDIQIVITGMESEKDDAREILNRADNSKCVDLMGKTSFPELLALYSLADLMITNDSGPAHFASLLKLPTIVLFGPETPRLYSPLNDACKCIYSGFACSPCVSVYNAKMSPCNDNRCMKAISVKEVFCEVIEMLEH